MLTNDVVSFEQLGPGISMQYFHYTVELQWLEHQWLVYHAYLEFVLESLGKHPIAADLLIFGIIYDDFLFYIDNGMLCVHSMRRF